MYLEKLADQPGHSSRAIQENPELPSEWRHQEKAVERIGGGIRGGYSRTGIPVAWPRGRLVGEASPPRFQLLRERAKSVARTRAAEEAVPPCGEKRARGIKGAGRNESSR